MTTPELKSADDHELQLAVNHLAHSTLTTNLLPALLASSTPPFNSRIIFLSSSPHRYSSIHWSNLNLTAEHDPYTAYGQSKTANLWTANHIDRLYGDRGVHALAVNPGGIWTGLQKAATAE
jgi:NAD(P)-dependent dehydrogenase (short-subunit alcohol dehydrogenase family)